MAEDEVSKKREEKTARIIKATKPKKVKNADGTSFAENLRGKLKPPYKGRHRDEEK